MRLEPGILLRSRDHLIGTGFPDANNAIVKDRICMFVKVRPFNTEYFHYQVLVLNYYEHPIIDDVIATPGEFEEWFEVVSRS